MKRDYSNFRAFDNIPCAEDEILYPVVLNEDMAETLKEQGLDRRNIVTVHIPRAKKGIPVVFIRIRKEGIDAAEWYFNLQVHQFLTKGDRWNPNLDSLDEIIERHEEDEDRAFLDPAASRPFEEDTIPDLHMDEIREKLSRLDPLYGRVFELLCQEYPKNEILQMVGWSRGKSQGYEMIRKVRHIARELYEP